MRVLLDSNAYSMLGRGHPFVAEIVRRSQEVILSAVVIGELLLRVSIRLAYGAECPRTR